MTHKDRFEKLTKYALSPPGTKERKLQEDFLLRTRSPEVTEKIKKNYTQLQAMFNAQMLNGSNHTMSSHIRDFLNEINDRNIRHGLWSLPSSFNIYEAFLEYIPIVSYFHLNPEREYEISLEDYFDFLTADAALNIDNALIEFSEREIISIAEKNNSTSFVFEGDGLYSYYIEGMSIIRYGNEFNFFASIGLNDQKYDFDYKNVDKIFGKKNIQPHKDHSPGKVMLKDNFQQTFIFYRIDIEKKTQGAKYILRDEGNNYTIVTDDKSSFADDKGKMIEGFEKAYIDSLKEIKRFEDIFQTIRSFIYVNEYFNKFDEEIKIRREKTELRDYFKKPSFYKLLKKAKKEDLIFYRDILIIDKKYNETSSKLTIVNPYFRLERGGYWKRLEPDRYGIDKDGNSTLGRTWVTTVETWTEDIKEENKTVDDSDGRAGYIYIMRNASHNKNIFKIGMTKRNPAIRAHEIYKTGSPDHFLIAQDWWVKDRFDAEKAIHKYFDKYRINDRREFFCVEFKELITVVDDIVSRVNK